MELGLDHVAGAIKRYAVVKWNSQWDYLVWASRGAPSSILTYVTESLIERHYPDKHSSPGTLQDGQTAALQNALKILRYGSTVFIIKKHIYVDRRRGFLEE